MDEEYKIVPVPKTLPSSSVLRLKILEMKSQQASNLILAEGQASNLQSSGGDFGKKPTFFVRIYLNNALVGSTKEATSELNPVWLEEFTIIIPERPPVIKPPQTIENPEPSSQKDSRDDDTNNNEEGEAVVKFEDVLLFELVDIRTGSSIGVVDVPVSSFVSDKPGTPVVIKPKLQNNLEDMSVNSEEISSTAKKLAMVNPVGLMKKSFSKIGLKQTASTGNIENLNKNSFRNLQQLLDTGLLVLEGCLGRSTDSNSENSSTKYRCGFILHKRFRLWNNTINCQ